jgi:hypothetical protein
MGWSGKVAKAGHRSCGRDFQHGTPGDLAAADFILAAPLLGVLVPT